MAKVAFSKLKCKLNDTEVSIQFNDESIQVKQYLPAQDKLILVGRIIELAHEEDYHFFNPLKTKMLAELEIVFAYTNISFTEKNKEALPKLYDMLLSSGLLPTILEAIPKEEVEMILQGVNETTQAIYAYQNSAMRIIDGLRNQYNQTEFDLNSIQEMITEMSESSIINNVLPLMGLE